MKVYGILFFLSLMSSVHAYHASVILDDDPLMLPSINHLVGLDNEMFLVSMIIDANYSSSYRVYSFLSTLTKSGFYRLATGVTGTITIATTDVMLDLSGNTITGGVVINSGLKNITIKRGTIIATGTDGILVNSGCSALSFYDIVVQNATRGINLTQATDSILERCTMTSNVTGLLLNSSSNVVVKSCNALRSSNTGFSLTLSTTCSLTDCKALSTGDGNTAAINNNIYGFISQNGFGNVFSGCIANGTLALSTTDYNSIVAGFALTGTEQFSQIRDSVASNAATNSGGVTVPYGIYLQNTLSGLLSVTTVVSTTVSNGNGIESVAWSSDGIYLAVGADFTNGTGLIVYRFNRLTQGLEQLASVSGNAVEALAWSPDGTYLLTAELNSVNNQVVQIYSFNRTSQTLTSLINFSFGTQLFGAAWSPDGKYFALAQIVPATGNTLAVYSFNSVANTVTLVATALSGVSARLLAWSPAQNYLLVGSSSGFYIFYFNPQTAQLTQTDFKLNGTSVSYCAWFPNQQYLAIVEGTSVQIYAFNTITGVSTLVTSSTVSSTTRSISISPDGRYLAVAGGPTGIPLYQFDMGTNVLTFSAYAILPGSTLPVCRAIAWSPDGNFIAFGYAASGSSGTTYLSIMNGLSFPFNNVIKNNIATCNTGGRFPSGIGISGSSIANLIMQNTAYDNPRNPSTVFSNYNFVCSVFNQLFGLGPTYLQNKEVNNIIVQPPEVDTTIKIIESKLSLIQAQVTALIPFS